MTDHFSGFCWGQTCKDKVADQLVEFVYDIFVKGQYGCLEIIFSNNGGEVTNRLIKSKK